MNRATGWRRGLKWTAVAFAALIGLVLLLAAALDEGYLRGPVVRWASLRTGRQIRVDGALRLHLLSFEPRLSAERVSFGNPAWTAPGVTAEIDKVVIVLALPGSGHGSGIVRLELQGATLYLLRDSVGHANWQRSDPDKGGSMGLAFIRSLSVLDAHLLLSDDLRHLKFDGKVSAQDVPGKPGEVQQTPAPLNITGAGELNGRSATIELSGDPLATASPAKPYGFRFSARSGASHISGSGKLLRPLDLTILDATFAAAGADLRDLYYLTGMKFIDTGPFELSGKIARRGQHSQVSDVAVTFGQSDVLANASVESSHGRSTIEVTLNSKLLRMQDLGLRAAGRLPEPDSPQRLLLSDAVPDFATWRRNRGRIHFHALTVDAGRIALQGLDAKLTLDYGLVTMTSLTAEVLGGKLAAELKVDARTDTPAAELKLQISDVQLGQLPHKGAGPAPMEGPLRAGFALKGRGKSIHQFAASADGTLTATLSNGTIRASLAELTGVDLRGLGLLLTKSKQEDAVRCGAARFEARNGTLSAQSFVVDTDPVLINAEGGVNLGSEAWDLKLQGHPKELRLLRLRAPVRVQGTLAHPKISIDAHESALVLVDRGRAKELDCAALLAAPEAFGARP